MDEGRLLPDGQGGFTYEYFLKVGAKRKSRHAVVGNHLGNTRVSFTGNNGTAMRTQEDSYYPYGMRQGGLSYSNGVENKYLYNGKELQDDDLGGVKLGWSRLTSRISDNQGFRFVSSGNLQKPGSCLYDYGARFYDAALGRFHMMDNYSEKYLSFSPYSYAANTPLLYIDINGDSIATIFYDADGNKLDYVPDEVQQMFNDEWGIEVGYNAETGMMYFKGDAETDQEVSESARKELVGALSDTKTGKDALKAYGKVTFGYNLKAPNGAPQDIYYGASSKTLSIFSDGPGIFKYREAYIDLADFDDKGNAYYMKFDGVPKRAFNMGRVFEHEVIGHVFKKKGDGSSIFYHRNPGRAANVVNKFRKEMGLPQRKNYRGKDGTITFESGKLKSTLAK